MSWGLSKADSHQSAEAGSWVSPGAGNHHHQEGLFKGSGSRLGLFRVGESPQEVGLLVLKPGKR